MLRTGGKDRPDPFKPLRVDAASAVERLHALRTLRSRGHARQGRQRQLFGVWRQGPCEEHIADADTGGQGASRQDGRVKDDVWRDEACQ